MTKKHSIWEILFCMVIIIFSSFVLTANFFFLISKPIAGLFLLCAAFSLYWMNFRRANIQMNKNITIFWCITALYAFFQLSYIGSNPHIHPYILRAFPFIHCILCLCYFLFSCLNIKNMLLLMRKEIANKMTEKDVPKLLLDSINILLLIGTFWTASLALFNQGHFAVFALYCLNSVMFFANKTFVDKEPEDALRYSFGILFFLNLLYAIFSLFFYALNSEMYFILSKVESFFSINWILPTVVYCPRVLYLSGNKVEKIDHRPFREQRGKIAIFLFLWIGSVAIIILTK